MQLISADPHVGHRGPRPRQDLSRARGRPASGRSTASTLSVARGTIFALVGPNGAGKTTTVKILTTLAAPDEGTATIEGIDVIAGPAQARRVIGVVAPALRRRPDGHRPGEPGPAGPPLRHADAAPRGREPTSCSTASSSPRRPAASSAPTPAACSAASTSRSAWCTAPGAVPRRADHRPRPGVTGGDVGRDHHGSRPPTRSPCCSPRTTWTRPTGSRAALAIVDRGRVVAEGEPGPAQAGARRDVARRGVPALRGPPVQRCARLTEVAGQ